MTLPQSIVRSTQGQELGTGPQACDNDPDVLEAESHGHLKDSFHAAARVYSGHPPINRTCGKPKLTRPAESDTMVRLLSICLHAMHSGRHKPGYYGLKES